MSAFIGNWVWVHKGGKWPKGAVQGPNKYFFVARSAELNTFGKALPCPDYDPLGCSGHESAIAWFPCEKKEVTPEVFEVLVYRGDIAENGYSYEWVKVIDYLQNEEDYELYLDFDGKAVYEHGEDLSLNKKRFVFAGAVREKVQGRREDSSLKRRAEKWDDELKLVKKQANAKPMGALILPSKAKFTSLGKEIVLREKDIEDGYVLSIHKVSKVVVEVVPEDIIPNMARRKPSSFFEENFTTSFLPQEYTFRKMYKTIQRSEFESEHSWEAGVSVEYGVQLFTAILADFKASHSSTIHGAYTITKENTREEETEFVYPIKIPPYTTSCLTATIWEEQLDIPYQANEVVYDQFNRVVLTRKTHGVWHGVSSYVANVVVKESFRKGFWIILITVFFVIVKFIWD